MATAKTTKAALKLKEAFVQYSKKMCTRVTIFWMLYRIIVLAIVFFRPDTSTALIQLTGGVDTVMIANMSVYCGNSICEKGFIAFGKRNPTNPNAKDDEDKKEDSDETDNEGEEENIDNG